MRAKSKLARTIVRPEPLEDRLPPSGGLLAEIPAGRETSAVDPAEPDPAVVNELVAAEKANTPALENFATISGEEGSKTIFEADMEFSRQQAMNKGPAPIQIALLLDILGLGLDDSDSDAEPNVENEIPDWVQSLGIVAVGGSVGGSSLGQAKSLPVDVNGQGLDRSTQDREPPAESPAASASVPSVGADNVLRGEFGEVSLATGDGNVGEEFLSLEELGHTEGVEKSGTGSGTAAASASGSGSASFECPITHPHSACVDLDWMTGAGQEDLIETTVGTVVAANYDDDNNNGVADYIPDWGNGNQDFDLKRLHVRGFKNGDNPSDVIDHLIVEYEDDHFEVWADQWKNTHIPSGTQVTVGQDLWVEGHTFGEEEVVLRGVHASGTKIAADAARALIVDIDITKVPDYVFKDTTFHMPVQFTARLSNETGNQLPERVSSHYMVAYSNSWSPVTLNGEEVHLATRTSILSPWGSTLASRTGGGNLAANYNAPNGSIKDGLDNDYTSYFSGKGQPYYDSVSNPSGRPPTNDHNFYSLNVRTRFRYTHPTTGQVKNHPTIYVYSNMNSKEDPESKPITLSDSRLKAIDIGVNNQTEKVEKTVNIDTVAEDPVYSILTSSGSTVNKQVTTASSVENGHFNDVNTDFTTSGERTVETKIIDTDQWGSGRTGGAEGTIVTGFDISISYGGRTVPGILPSGQKGMQLAKTGGTLDADLFTGGTAWATGTSDNFQTIYGNETAFSGALWSLGGIPGVNPWIGVTGGLANTMYNAVASDTSPGLFENGGIRTSNLVNGVAARMHPDGTIDYDADWNQPVTSTDSTGVAFSLAGQQTVTTGDVVNRHAIIVSRTFATSSWSDLSGEALAKLDAPNLNTTTLKAYHNP